MSKCGSRYGGTVVNEIDEFLEAENNSGSQYTREGGRWLIKN